MPPISSFGSAPLMVLSSPAAATASTQFRRSLLATILLLADGLPDYATVGWAKAARVLVGFMAPTPPCPRGHRRRVGTAVRAACHHGDISAAFAHPTELGNGGFRAALRRDAHGLQDFRIGRAATEIARQIMPDIVVARVRIGVEQLL